MEVLRFENAAGNEFKSLSRREAHKSVMSMAGRSEDVSMFVKCANSIESVLKTDEARLGAVSGDESHEAEFREEETFNKCLGSKKRRRSNKDSFFDQVKGPVEPPIKTRMYDSNIQQKADENPTSVDNKSAAKHGKGGSHTSDTPKQDYVYVRARRGQATNSHSLAERVRREKISERMKFLQDLVPGCGKVTGKALMLDEIINYVQSLQQQVEFLSMKLATVDPQMDFNNEGMLSEDILQSRAGPSSKLGFHQDMTVPYPFIHPPQFGNIQTYLPDIRNFSDASVKSISSHLAAINGGYDVSTSKVQAPSEWDDELIELHDIIQMGLNPNIPLSRQDLGSYPPGHPKAEP